MQPKPVPSDNILSVCTCRAPIMSSHDLSSTGLMVDRSCHGKRAALKPEISTSLANGRSEMVFGCQPNLQMARPGAGRLQHLCGAPSG